MKKKCLPLQTACLAVATACLSVLAACLLVSCSEDDDVADAYCQNLAELLTDHAGGAQCLVTDNGDTLALTNASAWTGLVRDSTYRVQAVYVQQSEGVELVGAARIFSPQPITLDDSRMHRDPLTLNAVWRGGRYLNLSIGYKTGGATHTFAFINRGVTTLASGGQLLRLELYHDQSSDPLNYTQQAYLSCPLWATELTEKRDSVEITVNTFSGSVVRRFAR